MWVGRSVGSWEGMSGEEGGGESGGSSVFFKTEQTPNVCIEVSVYACPGEGIIARKSSCPLPRERVAAGDLLISKSTSQQGGAGEVLRVAE